MAERLEVLGLDHERAGSADHVLLVVGVSPPGGCVCMGLVASGISLRMTRPLMVKPCATAASRASVTGRPELLVPSPDTSITRRSD